MSVASPTTPAVTTADPAPLAPPAPRRRRLPGVRRALIVLAPLALLAVALFAYSTYREGVLYVSTDNAQLTGQPVQVGSINAGRVEAIDVHVGSAVRRGDRLAVLTLPSTTGAAQNGQPELQFLGPSDSRVDLVAPIDGIVIAVPVAPGATVQAGQPIVAVVDPTHLWVNANIDETSVRRLRVGQGVQVHLDALDADAP